MDKSELDRDTITAWLKRTIDVVGYTRPTGAPDFLPQDALYNRFLKDLKPTSPIAIDEFHKLIATYTPNIGWDERLVMGNTRKYDRWVKGYSNIDFKPQA